MRHPRRPFVLLVAAVMAVAGCAAPGDVSDPVRGHDAAPESEPPSAPEAPALGQPVHHDDPTADVALCTVLPTRIVGDLVSARTLDASGDGSQCTWRLQVPGPRASAGDPAPTPDLAAAEVGDATLQGAFLDVAAFHAGRPPVDEAADVADVDGVGDEAFVVHLGETAPSTLYVRDGQRTLSLWLDDVPMAPEATERSLARVASLLLDLA